MMSTYGGLSWLISVLLLLTLFACVPQTSPDPTTPLPARPEPNPTAQVEYFGSLMQKGDLDAINRTSVMADFASPLTAARPFDALELQQLKALLDKYPQIKDTLNRINFDPRPPLVERVSTPQGNNQFQVRVLVIFNVTFPDQAPQKIELQVDRPREDFFNYVVIRRLDFLKMMGLYRLYILDLGKRLDATTTTNQPNSSTSPANPPAPTNSLPSTNSSNPVNLTTWRTLIDQFQTAIQTGNVQAINDSLLYPYLNPLQLTRVKDAVTQAHKDRARVIRFQTPTPAPGFSDQSGGLVHLNYQLGAVETQRLTLLVVQQSGQWRIVSAPVQFQGAVANAPNTPYLKLAKFLEAFHQCIGVLVPKSN